MISVEEAQSLILANTSSLGDEAIDLAQALGRVLVEDVVADRDYPPFHRAAMDGFAFRWADVMEHDIRSFTIAGELFAGYDFTDEIPQGHCLKIMTGASTPPYLDCIVQIELTAISADGTTVSFPNVPLRKGQNIAKKGEDCKEKEIILKKGTFIRPTEIGILAVLGKQKCMVQRTPKIAIISTGDELVPVGQPISTFQIRDSNAFVLQAFFQSLQTPVARKEIVKDNKEALSQLIKEVTDYDIVVLSGGVSMGAADYVPQILAANNVEKIFHKVQLKPGKPIWFGKSLKGGLFFGLPGNPLSCQVCFKLFIEPAVRQMVGLPKQTKNLLPFMATRKQKVKLNEYIPVHLKDDEIHPVAFNGSGDVTSVLGSTGIALHPIDKNDLEAGDLAQYIAW